MRPSPRRLQCAIVVLVGVLFAVVVQGCCGVAVRFVEEGGDGRKGSVSDIASEK